MGKVPLRRRDLFREGVFFGTHTAGSTGTAAHNPLPPGLGVLAPAPPPARSSAPPRSGAARDRRCPSCLLNASLSPVSARGGEAGAERMNLEEDQVRKNGLEKRNGAKRKRESSRRSRAPVLTVHC